MDSEDVLFCFRFSADVGSKRAFADASFSIDEACFESALPGTGTQHATQAFGFILSAGEEFGRRQMAGAKGAGFRVHFLGIVCRRVFRTGLGFLASFIEKAGTGKIVGGLIFVLPDFC